MAPVILDSPSPMSMTSQILDRLSQLTRVPELDEPIITTGDQDEGLVGIEINIPDTRFMRLVDFGTHLEGAEVPP